jgi:hypothetical protein
MFWSPDWTYEPKCDGCRVLATIRVSAGRVANFPDITIFTSQPSRRTSAWNFKLNENLPEAVGLLRQVGHDGLAARSRE